LAVGGWFGLYYYGRASERDSECAAQDAELTEDFTE
jgi:hypothetical protein